MDVITLISKRTDLSGKLPGEYGSELDDLPVGEEGYSNPNPFCADGPRQDEFLAEMRREVFEGVRASSPWARLPALPHSATNTSPTPPTASWTCSSYSSTLILTAKRQMEATAT